MYYICGPEREREKDKNSPYIFSSNNHDNYNSATRCVRALGSAQRTTDDIGDGIEEAAYSGKVVVLVVACEGGLERNGTHTQLSRERARTK